MKRLIALLLFLGMGLVVSGQSAFAQGAGFSDVPRGHWAENAIRAVVQAGIVQGYPDGTYQGKRTVTRYEIAILAARLLRAARGGVDQRALNALQQEIAALKAQMGADDGGPSPGQLKVSGEYMSQLRAGNVLATKTASGTTAKKGPRADYQLKATAERNWGKGNSVKVNLDTMDYGFNTGVTTTPDLTRELIDIEGNFVLDMAGMPVRVKTTAGPGPQLHTESPTSLFPYEEGVVYLRPRTATSVGTSWEGLDLMGKFEARGTNNLSGPAVKHYVLWAGYDLGSMMGWNTRIAGTGELFSDSALGSGGSKDLRGRVDVSMNPMEKVKLSAAVGFSGTKNSNQLYVGGDLHLNDVWETGSDVVLAAHKVGSQYLGGSSTNGVGTLQQVVSDPMGDDLLTSTGVYLKEGSVNLSGVLKQVINDKWGFTGLVDVNMAGQFKYGSSESISNASFMGGVTYMVNPAADLDLSWTVYKDEVAQDTSDILGARLSYRF